MRMGDGPIENLPAGLDAYAGYVNKSGIGITYPQIVNLFPTAHHLSITTDGSPADCADVEAGAMSSWAGYQVGYSSASMVGTLTLQFGRPRKLWAAHYTGVAHICTSAVCWPSSPIAWTADGTQWTDHGGAWDESLLADTFFDFQTSPIPPSHPGKEYNNMIIALEGSPDYWIVDGHKIALDQTSLEALMAAPVPVVHLTPYVYDQVVAALPGGP